MARQRMVTRTIKAMEVTVLCLDTDTAEPCNRTVTLSGVAKNEKALLKAVKKLIESDNFKVVKVVDINEFEAKYVMPETEFIAHATVQ